ncbi:MAG: hypothetical protein BGO63_00320 [Candidatus Accumulibacter sp. 66-26]|nr:MAG: hypothetical protein BGO63_00320 [Candidatus Accumulibacter sp. 66-26]
MHRAAKRCAIAGAVSLALSGGAYAADGVLTSAGQVFTLGQITVTGNRDNESALGTATLDREQLWDFSKDGVAEALNLIPGVATTTGAGNRNETGISIRGFDRFQVPLLMDGIRLYLPADNRIDLDRFLTPDLSEVQVSKGYVSVLNGPDGMGGAINLVTRKPVKPFEGEVRATAALAGGGEYNGNTVYANLGGRSERFYYQISAQQRDVDSWRLSRDFKPTVAEDGGKRDHTSKNDRRFSLKAGFTPNATDEYSLNYVTQSGEKHGIGAVTGTSTISAWDWPTWDTSGLYFLSHTALGDKSWLKAKAYYNEFRNDLVAYTNVSLTTKNWTSTYDDNAKGLSLELGTTHFARQTLKAALHYRRDDHSEWQLTHATNFTEPRQTTIEDTMSAALEDTWHVTRNLDLIGGISRDIRRSKQAQEYASNVLFNQPMADSFATNYQAAAIWRYSGSGKLHASASDRTRFPTMADRFSSRFGGAISNPWLKPERALNLEIGIAETLWPGVRGEAAIFHNKVRDAIQYVPIVYNGTNQSQNRNVGEAVFKGVEFGLAAQVSRHLEVGGNYTWIDTRIDAPNDPSLRLTTAPQNKGFLYAKWTPNDALTVIPSLEAAGARWSTKAVGNGYVRTGAYQLLALKVEYKLRRDWDIALTGRNLLDKNYQLVDGYPQEGRNFLLSTRLQF